MAFGQVFVNHHCHAMKKSKAIIYFRDYLAAELGPVAQVIHVKMCQNATTFPQPPVAMDALQTLITTYDERLAARASGASTDVIALQQARESLEQALRVLGSHINGLAKGSPVIVEQSEFPSYTGKGPADTSPPEAPADVRLRHGKLSSFIVLRYRPKRTKSANEVQTTMGDPNEETDWLTAGVYRGGRAEIGGFTPGSLLWLRVRTIGLRGIMGAWSDPAQIRVL
jgi:hypothetical protein